VVVARRGLAAADGAHARAWPSPAGPGCAQRRTRTLHSLSVGFNPFRKARRSSADYLMVAAALAVCALLVIWALFG